jgi:hypothetical protein
VQLYQRLRSLPGALAIPWVRELSLETWTVDADVVVNLVRLLQIDTARVTTLSLFIGPNFAPEHLAEMFGRPIPHLRYISIRFRP